MFCFLATLTPEQDIKKSFVSTSSHKAPKLWRPVWPLRSIAACAGSEFSVISRQAIDRSHSVQLLLVCFNVLYQLR